MSKNKEVSRVWTPIVMTIILYTYSLLLFCIFVFGRTAFGFIIELIR